MTTAESLHLPAPAEVELEFDHLYRRHLADVLGYTRSVVDDPGQAEDLAQSTFLKAYRALSEGGSPEHPREWLIAIARNECGMHFRAASRRLQEVALDDELALPERSDARAVDVREALEQLGGNQREALVMRELEGRSYDEIASALQLSSSAVETLLFRARRALREQIETASDCADAQRLIASSATLTEEERAELRAHVRSCRDCAKLERRQRGLRSVLARVASLLPFPGWLSSFFGGAAAKTATVVAVATITAGGTATVVATTHHHRHAHRAPAVQPAQPTARSVAATTPRRAPVAAAPPPFAARPSARSTRPVSLEALARLRARLARAKSIVVPPISQRAPVPTVASPGAADAGGPPAAPATTPPGPPAAIPAVAHASLSAHGHHTPGPPPGLAHAPGHRAPAPSSPGPPSVVPPAHPPRHARVVPPVNAPGHAPTVPPVATPAPPPTASAPTPGPPVSVPAPPHPVPPVHGP